MHNGPLHRLDHAEEAISLLVNAGGEEELIGLSRLPTKAEHQSPQAINDDGVAFLVRELAQEGAGIGIERIFLPLKLSPHQGYLRAQLRPGTSP